MSQKPANDERTKPGSEPDMDEKSQSGRQEGLAERSVTEHHVPGAEGPSGAEAEEDNNP